MIDKSTTVIVPTRMGVLDTRFVGPLLTMIAPLSSRRDFLFCAGFGVADAYNELVAKALEMDTAFILTLEDDNIVERGTHVKLMDSIGDYDAISALYYLKDDDERVPLVFGYDLLPLDVQGKAGVVPCGGIPFGCALWRTRIFRELSPPWFRTIEAVNERRTHDLYFASKLASANYQVAVNLDVRVGHMDYRTGKVY
jgi:hypothetical protein